MIPEQELISFIQKLSEGADQSLKVDDSLFKSRRLDSITILQLIAFIETKLGRKLNSDEIVLENFDSVQAITNFFHDN